MEPGTAGRAGEPVGCEGMGLSGVSSFGSTSNSASLPEKRESFPETERLA